MPPKKDPTESDGPKNDQDTSLRGQIDLLYLMQHRRVPTWAHSSLTTCPQLLRSPRSKNAPAQEIGMQKHTKVYRADPRTSNTSTKGLELSKPVAILLTTVTISD
jgi:hypothetical protein